MAERSGRAELRQLYTTSVDADKIQQESIEFQQNVAVKEIFLLAHLKTACQRKASPIFFHSLQRKFSLCLGLPAAAGGANCPLLHVTDVELGPPLSLYFSFSICLVCSRFLGGFRSIIW